MLTLRGGPSRSSPFVLNIECGLSWLQGTAKQQENVSLWEKSVNMWSRRSKCHTATANYVSLWYQTCWSGFCTDLPVSCSGERTSRGAAICRKTRLRRRRTQANDTGSSRPLQQPLTAYTLDRAHLMKA